MTTQTPQSQFSDATAQESDSDALVMQYAIEQGKKLGFLIASLDVPEEMRDELLMLIPRMPLAQLQELTEVLETKFLDSSTRYLDEFLQSELEKNEKRYQDRVLFVLKQITERLNKASVEIAIKGS